MGRSSRASRSNPSGNHSRLDIKIDRFELKSGSPHKSSQGRSTIAPRRCTAPFPAYRSTGLPRAAICHARLWLPVIPLLRSDGSDESAPGILKEDGALVPPAFGEDRVPGSSTLLDYVITQRHRRDARLSGRQNHGGALAGSRWGSLYTKETRISSFRSASVSGMA